MPEGSRRCHVISLLAGCRVDLPVHAAIYTNRKNALETESAGGPSIAAIPPEPWMASRLEADAQGKEIAVSRSRGGEKAVRARLVSLFQSKDEPEGSGG